MELCGDTVVKLRLDQKYITAPGSAGSFYHLELSHIGRRKVYQLWPVFSQMAKSWLCKKVFLGQISDSELQGVEGCSNAPKAL